MSRAFFTEVVAYLAGVVMQIQQCGFAHAFLIEINNETIPPVPVKSYLNRLIPQVHGAFIL